MLGIGSAAALMCGLVVLASAATVHAGVNFWTSHGPYGGDVVALAIDPVTPSTLYAATNSGVSKSTDSGTNWSAVNTRLSSYPAQHIRALAIDP